MFDIVAHPFIIVIVVGWSLATHLHRLRLKKPPLNISQGSSFSLAVPVSALNLLHHRIILDA